MERKINQNNPPKLLHIDRWVEESYYRLLSATLEEESTIKDLIKLGSISSYAQFLHEGVEFFEENPEYLN